MASSQLAYRFYRQLIRQTDWRLLHVTRVARHSASIPFRHPCARPCTRPWSTNLTLSHCSPSTPHSSALPNSHPLPVTTSAPHIQLAKPKEERDEPSHHYYHSPRRPTSLTNMDSIDMEPGVEQVLREEVPYVPHETLTQRVRVLNGGSIPQRVKDILTGVRMGSRSKLAEAITLVETKHPAKHQHAQWLLNKILSHRSKQAQLGKLKPTFRIGLSGPPGAGKSTIIETLGQLLTGQGYKVAVLAVDPSSARTGGSILGDKTRMFKLSQDPNAYIRPSPSGGSLGGVNRSTHEAISLCEGAGYDIVIVETVGVGQSETAVCDMTDMFVLLLPPAAGDELQGLKKGIVEMADLVVINKADGDLLPAARRIKAEYISALKLVRGKTLFWKPKVMMVSALTNQGVEGMWETMQEFQKSLQEAGELDTKRKSQQRLWLWNHINWQLMQRFSSHNGMPSHISHMEERVMAGSLAPGTAADLLLDEFFNSCSIRTD